jgi:16S rRNA G966 N2-methylase RsmD
MAPERKLYQDLRKRIPQISWTRLENLSLLGTPDLLGYNTSGHFFTLELKVVKGKKIRFSPHQISFHVQHPKSSFILIRHLGQRCLKLFQGSVILELEACGFDARSLRLIKDRGAWSLLLEAFENLSL